MKIVNFLILNKAWDVTWKTLLIIFLIAIILIVLIGLLGNLIRFIMRYQAKAVDKDMSKYLVSRVIDNPKEFKEIAYKKSNDRFFKIFWLPFSLGMISLFLWIGYHASFGRWDESIFNRETGIASLFYGLDFSSIEFLPPLGFNWDEWVWIEPNVFNDERIFNYFIFLFALLSISIYLIIVQAYVARNYKIRKLSKSLFSANLDKMDLNNFYNQDKKGLEEDKPAE